MSLSDDTIVKYEGTVTDNWQNYGQGVNATRVYGLTSNNNNNIIFGGFCWQIIRTTETGGTKLIYNGEPDGNNACGTNRSTHIGYTLKNDSQSLNDNYYYGTDYIYENGTFKLSGTINQETLDNDIANRINGKYTCLSTESMDSTCSVLYWIESVSIRQNNATNTFYYTAHVGTLNNTIKYPLKVFNIRIFLVI